MTNFPNSGSLGSKIVLAAAIVFGTRRHRVAASFAAQNIKLKHGNSRRRNISHGSAKESAVGTRFCSTPSLLICQSYNFSKR